MSEPRSRPWNDSSDSENDEFPDLDALVHRTQQGKKAAVHTSTTTSSVRRRRLRPIADNVLLKPWNRNPSSQLLHGAPPSTPAFARPPTRSRVQLSTRKQEPVTEAMPTRHDKAENGSRISLAEVSLDEELSADNHSESHDAISQCLDDTYDPDDSPRPKYATIKASPVRQSRRQEPKGTVTGGMAPLQKQTEPQSTEGSARRHREDIASLNLSGISEPDDDLVGAINRLRIADFQPPAASRSGEYNHGRPATPPPSNFSKPRSGLVSPKKLPKIPTTPHHPASDMFWSRDFVDDWNDEHSPKKQLFPDPSKSPGKQSARPKKKASTKMATDRDAKKAFEKTKHDTAIRFLEELDRDITQGRLSDLAETSGGIKINWTNKLNTTAGRANWKRETIRTKNADGSEASVKYRHHASIELAEKVIDNEHRLLNVVAHEFCHLANFMVSGITKNPHGKEFKAWAATCSRVFGDRGIEVTTRHSYDIAFKYVWECGSCAMEYKRHSKSINPERHRCGSCKSELKQTRPVPRASSGRPSEYQVFMKKQMKLLKEENPRSPQKDIMKQVAERWSSMQATSKSSSKPLRKAPVTADELAVGVEFITLEDTDGE